MRHSDSSNPSLSKNALHCTLYNRHRRRNRQKRRQRSSLLFGGRNSLNSMPHNILAPGWFEGNQKCITSCHLRIQISWNNTSRQLVSKSIFWIFLLSIFSVASIGYWLFLCHTNVLVLVTEIITFFVIIFITFYVILLIGGQAASYGFHPRWRLCQVPGISREKIFIKLPWHKIEN